MSSNNPIIDELKTVFSDSILAVQPTRDDILTLWVSREKARDVLRHLKTGIDRPYHTLYDLTAIDERTRTHRSGQPESNVTFVYHLLSFILISSFRSKERR